MYELIIQNEKEIYLPAVKDEITWDTERKISPGKLSFTLIQDGDLKIDEGNPVRLKQNGKEVFYGFIFERSYDEGREIKVTAYDQLRYLKNKDTFVYENKKAGEVVEMLAADFGLRTGDIEDTKYVIPSRVEDNATLADIIQNALTLTLQHTNMLYVLYDDFGKIALKSIPSMELDLLIDEETGQAYSYKTSIDGETYNKIKLTFENEETGKREIYIAKDSSNINKWGVLQFYEALQEGESGNSKADSLLKLYNKKEKSLSVKGCFGDVRVRGGSLIPVILDLGDMKIKHMMIVDKCKHTFSKDYHTMDLDLIGGDISAG